MKSAVLRLSVSYLCIIMAVSILFSFLIYEVSAREVGRGLRRGFDVVYSNPDAADTLPPTSFGIGGPGPNTARIESVREEQLESARTNLKAQLALLNLLVLLAGAGVSYWLAKRHIDPIHEAMEAQSRFTSDAAHELRTPLTAMKTELEVSLRDKKLTPAAARALLESNLEEVDKLTTLTNALLRLAQGVNGQEKAHWKVVSLHIVANEAAKQFSSLAKERTITLDTSELHAVKVRGDQEQLIEAVIILLDNAFKYGRDGMNIRLTTRQSEGKAELTVTDQGIGIKASDLRHIFERFYRADQSRTKQKVSGYGLGLSLAQAIIHRHNGTIEAHSEPDIGTTFIIRLPLSALSQQKNDNNR